MVVGIYTDFDNFFVLSRVFYSIPFKKMFVTYSYVLMI
jgi:hypothetical protein